MNNQMMQVQDDGSWRTPGFRQNLVQKIEETLVQCGTPTNKNAAEMENQVYSKATNKTEYLGFVARLIIHIKEMGNKSKGLPPGGGGQMQGQGQGQGQGAPVMAQGMNNVNQMQQMGQNPQQQQHPGMIGQGNMMMNQGMQQQQQQPMMQQQQPMMQQQQPMMQQQQQQPMMQQQQQPMMQQQISMPQQIGQNQQVRLMGQQQPQQGQMNLFQQQQQQQQMQQLQQQQGGPQQIVRMPNNSNPQMMQQNQMQQQQQMLLHQQQQQQQAGMGRGMRMPIQQMQQMQQMQRKPLPPQQQQQQHRPMGPGGMGMIPNRENNGNYSARLYSHSYGSPQGDGGMGGQFQGQMQRPPSAGQFIAPGSAGGMGMGIPPAPSPNSGMGGMGTQSGFVNSPQPLHPHGSPAPPGGTIRPFGNQMVPSPSTNLNTPMPIAPTPSPRNPEELACMKKIEELRRYTDMIQRMIVKIGNDDAEKSSKMKKLLNILMNPSREVSMDILLKCEVALKKMEKQQQHETVPPQGPPSQPTMPPKDQVSPFLQLQEAILTTLRNGSASHTFLRTFRPSIEALTGQTAMGPEVNEEVEAILLQDRRKEETPEVPPTLAREIKAMGSRFPVSIHSRGRRVPVQLKASIGDPKLPRVPPMKLMIPPDYPEDSPVLLDFKKDYTATPLLRTIAQAFKTRKVFLSGRFTLTELLITWEMSIRQVSNPLWRKKKKDNKEKDKDKSDNNTSNISNKPIKRLQPTPMAVVVAKPAMPTKMSVQKREQHHNKIPQPPQNPGRLGLQFI